MNRSDLAKALAKKTKLTTSQAEKLIIAFGKTVEEALSKNEKIVYSNFGSFYTVHYPSKVIYHPVLGKAKKIIMLPTDAAKWMPSGNIKSLVDSGKEVESATRFGASKEIGTKKANREESVSASKQIEQEHKTEDSKQSYNRIIEQSDDSKTEQSIKDNSNESENEYVIPIKHDKTSKQVSSKGRPAFGWSSKQISEEPNNEEQSDKQSKITIPPKDNIVDQAIFGTTDVPDKAQEEKTEKPSFWEQLFKKISGEDTKSKNLERASKALGKEKPVKEPEKSEEKKEEVKKHEKVSLKDSGIFEVGKEDVATLMASDSKSANKQEDGETEQPHFAEATRGKMKNKETEERKDRRTEGQKDEKQSKESDEPELEEYEKKTPITYMELTDKIIPREILQNIPEKIARKYNVAPIEVNKDGLVVAMVDPENVEIVEIVKKITQKNVIPTLSTEEDVNGILDQYQGFESEVKEAIEDVEEEGGKTKTEVQKEAMKTLDYAPATRIVNSLLRRAIRDKASDIHVEPLEKEVVVRFRIDGVLHKKVVLPKDIQAAVVSKIKIMSDLKIDEQRLPQDGRFSINYEERRVDFRISTMPTAFGEKVVMRILDKVSGIISVENLGLNKRDVEVLTSNCTKSHGMILVTGPTGSGKTTTLYALIEKIYSEGINIVTLEDPIEYQVPGVNQSQVNPEINYTFASGLRSILRQDPDAIMIGEIRDSETAEMAVHAALTGHIVLSTLHTNDAPGAIPRLLDMKIEPFLLTSSLNIVVGQRLARKVCESCREEVKVEEAEMKKIKEEVDLMPTAAKAEIKEFKFYKGKGCKNCDNVGYRGRVGLYEVLEVTGKIKELTVNNASSDKIKEAAISEGMTTMIQDGIMKAAVGITTIEEVWRVTKE